MILSRRVFLAGAGTLLLPYGASISAAQIPAGPLFAAAWLDGDKAGFAILDRDGAILRSIPLPGRGHDVVADGRGDWLVAFARRPGTFAVAISRSGQHDPVAFATPPDRHFYGHGCFSRNGRLLYATENDFANARGLIGIYDVTAGFRRIGEFSSFGLDPHELMLMADGRTLCIANGGIETHPDFGRAKLNLDSMEPSIVFIDVATGDLVEKHVLPAALRRLSTRHMDVDGHGRVWIGCQYEGPKADTPPLLLRVAKGEEIDFVDLPDAVLPRLANYVGSVACNKDTSQLVITSPHGNCAIILDAQDGRVVRLIEETDVCGAAPDRTAFILSSAEGRFGEVSEPVGWDNHIARLTDSRISPNL